MELKACSLRDHSVVYFPLSFQDFRDPWPSALDFLEGNIELDIGEVEALLFR